MGKIRFPSPVLWVGLASVLGFLASFVFSTWLRLPRSAFLVPYALLVPGYLVLFFRRHPLSLRQFAGPWLKGSLAAMVASVFLLENIAAQAPSPVPEGAQLAGAIAWQGIAYGILDGLFLNVAPTLSVLRSPGYRNPNARARRFLRGSLALGASILVTAAYHLGYAEFRNSSLLPVLLGNSVMTLAYLLSGSPAAAVLSHAAMHVGAVLHGAESTLQLPPHYP